MQMFRYLRYQHNTGQNISLYFFIVFFLFFRCTLEQKTYWEGFSIAKQTVFKTEAFRYLSSGNTIFVECLIRVCLDTDSTADCSLCAPAPSVGRKRRDVAQQIEGNSKEQASQTMTARSPVFYILERGMNINIFVVLAI